MGNTSRSREGFYKRGQRTHSVKGHGFAKVPDVGRCSECGKLSYESRSAAKKVAKIANAKVGTDHAVEPYTCPLNPHLWHTGGKKLKQ